MHFAHQLGLRIRLSEYSPIPGTADGELCRQWADLDEPLNQNKVAFTHTFLGRQQLQKMKTLALELNRSLPAHQNTEGNQTVSGTSNPSR